jgi:hypothetical protein
MEQRDARIAELERKISLYQENAQSKQKSAVWEHFDSIINKMSEQERAFVGGTHEVIAKRQQLMSTFNDWLFYKYRDEFSSIPEFNKLSGEYVDLVQTTAKDFGRKAVEVEAENAELRRQLAELQAKHGENML